MKTGLFIGAFWVLLSGSVAAAETLESLINSGRYQEAYEQALPQLEQSAGEPNFDFLFGMAAVGSGHPQEALFAFERVLLLLPQDHRARLELGRAHFMLGNFDRARQLFDEVLAANPPPRVRENIQLFMVQLNKRDKQRNSQLSGGIDLKIGSDSNINSATEVQNITLPIGLTLSLGDSSREIADEFYELALNGSYLKLLRKDMGLFGTFSLSDHQNVSYNQFDLRATGISFGYLYKGGAQTVRIPLQWQMLEVDRSMFRTSAGLGLEWSMSLARQQLALFGQWAQQRHNASETLRDVDLGLAGGAWSYDYTPWRTKLSLSLYQANEAAIDNSYDYFGRSYLGGRFSLQWQPGVKHELQLSWSRQSVEHDATHPVFGVVREDEYGQVLLEWSWHLDANWTLGAELSHVRNRSNIDIYTYDRSIGALSLGFHF